MIIDARSSGLPSSFSADVVIIGSGAAGITLALELAAAQVDVILAEAGGDNYTAAEQEFYRAGTIEPESHGPVHLYRRRNVGGSTSVWGGRCIPFDPIDFEERPWIGHSRWPITYSDVARYYPRATEYTESGPPVFTATEALSGPGPMIDGVISPDVILDRIERFSPPTHFGKRYRRCLTTDSRIRLFTHAPVESILTSSGRNVVSGVRVALSTGSKLEMHAPHVIVAAGGLETPRLLLSSDQERPCGLGNEKDLVGRFYQCHLGGDIGRIIFTKPASNIRLDYQRSKEGIYCRRYIWLSPDAQRRKQLSGLVIRPTHASIVNPEHRHPVLSAMYIVKSMVEPEYARNLTLTEDTKHSDITLYAGHIRNLLLGAPQLAAFSAKWLRHRILSERKLPSVVLKDPRCTYPLDINAEQEPNPTSRVTLGHERDALGMRRIHIDWRTTEHDHQRLLEGLKTIQTAFASSKTATLDLSSADLEEAMLRRTPVGGHHIGTARMGLTPEDGVCDSNGEVFGTRGLYIAGSAAFTTSSFANPTLTIVALSLRLAEHILRKIKP